jgi:hypothetical protein
MTLDTGAKSVLLSLPVCWMTQQSIRAVLVLVDNPQGEFMAIPYQSLSPPRGSSERWNNPNMGDKNFDQLDAIVRQESAHDQRPRPHLEE